MHLAPETSAFSLAPRTHISRANVIMKHLTAQTFFSATTRGSQQFTCSIPLQAVYTCAAAVCVSPCSLVISTHSGCTIWCTSDNESDYQWTSDCLLTPCLGIVTSAVNPYGACNCQLWPWPRGKSAHSAAAKLIHLYWWIQWIHSLFTWDERQWFRI